METTSGLSSAIQDHGRFGPTGFLCAPARSVRRWAAVFGLAFVFLPAAAAQANDPSDPPVARQETATTPDAPGSLVATTEDGGVVLEWAAPADDGGSNVLRYEMRNAEGASVPADTPWSWAGTNTEGAFRQLTNGTLYSFEVRAVSLGATPGDGEVVLTWQAPASNGGSAVTRYDYRHAEGASVPEETAWQSAGTSLTATIDGLANGTAYAFEVRAVNDEGEGEPAIATSTPATVPGRPQNLVATSGDGEVVLTWQAPASNGGSAVTDYEYRHAEGASVPEETVWQSAGASLTATITSLTNGTAYAFEVRAVSDAGEGAPAATSATPATVPGSPQNLVATSGDGEVVLTWEAPASDGSSPITGYEYRYAEGASVPDSADWVSVGASLSATVGGLADGVAHAFQVRAVNEVGHGAPSETTATVLQLPVLSANDARAEERADAAMGFTIELSRGSTRVVTVDYATADGSAKASEDYERTVGTLVFAAGETEKTVPVPLLRDARDEGEETFSLALSNARNARIGKARATGTIANDRDAIPGEWLVRFGRTVARQIVDAVSERLEGSPRGHATVGGVPVSPGAASAAPEVSPAAAVRPLRLAGDGQRTGQPARNIPLLGSSFHVSSPERGEGPVLSAWGRVAAGGFDARVEDVRMDGQVRTGLLAVDSDWGRMTLGAAIANSRGRGTFAYDGPRPSSRARGRIQSTLTGIYPYARLRVDETVSLWGLAGMGRGRLTLTEEGGAPVRTDTALTLGAIGARKTLLPALEAGGIALSIESDAFWVRTSSESVRSETVGNLEASRGEVTQLRLGLLGERSFSLGEGQILAPSLSIGVRSDGGDAETGRGLEIGGGIVWSDAARGISARLDARRLVTHDAQGLKDWGMSGSARFEPTPSSQRGLSLSLSTSAGRPATPGAGALSGPGAFTGLPEHGGRPAGMSVVAEAAYGTPMPGGRLVGAPFVRTGFSDSGRDYSLGWRLEAAHPGRLPLAFSVAGTRSERSDGGRPELGVGVSLTLRW